jgi:hypothetical protein
MLQISISQYCFFLYFINIHFFIRSLDFKDFAFLLLEIWLRWKISYLAFSFSISFHRFGIYGRRVCLQLDFLRFLEEDLLVPSLVLFVNEVNKVFHFFSKIHLIDYLISTKYVINLNQMKAEAEERKDIMTELLRGAPMDEDDEP